MQRTKKSWRGFWGTVTDENAKILIDELQNNPTIREELEKALHSKRGSDSRDNTNKIVKQFLIRVLQEEIVEKYKK